MSPTTYVAQSAVHPRPAALYKWERLRDGPLSLYVQLIAEATGTFLYTFAGAGATAAFILGNVLGIPGLGSLFQVGAAYSVGIALALVVSFATSHGHFNPGITVHAMVFKRFPVVKGSAYIIAQIVGSYIACLMIYVQYKQLIDIAIETLKTKGEYETLMFTPSGPGGIFGLYIPPGSNLGYVAFNEFICDFVLALVIFSCAEPSNNLSTPTTMPWLVALAYGVIIWGYAPVGVAANAARDLGGRFAALTLFGKAATGGNYAAIAALMNIPATLLAGLFYELVFNDSTRPVNAEWHALHTGTTAQADYKAGNGDTSSLRESTRSDEKIHQA